MSLCFYFKQLLECFWIHWQHLHLQNRNFTLFSNDCIGGVITHNVGVSFNSPTVNLFFESLSQYISFLENISHYIEIPVEYSHDEMMNDLGKSYPVGILRSIKYGDVVIHFMHYKNFEEARESWNRRSRRINLCNSFAIFHFHEWNDSVEQLLERFAQLPMRGKLVVSYPNIIPVSYSRGGYAVFIHPNVNEFRPGVLLQWKNRLHRRYIDDFDYVSWLNCKP